tara:strand:- start:26172 stop:26975 length:804 start_codon:yes stop_codon:yes gene_type:complete
MEKIRWRGTVGVGDFMQALNVCHRYSFDHNISPVNLEMHWEHGEDYLFHPDDPETIIQRLHKIHDMYYQNTRVEVTHVFDSDMFHYEDVDLKLKNRFFFDSERYDPTGSPPNDWIFHPHEFQNPQKKIVIFTPHYNKEPPRYWKRWLTGHDWYGIIELLRWEGWIVKELTYRTPIMEAYEHIKECRFIVSYDGMWHYIGRNFSKPHLIPSKEGVTSYNTPNAYKCKDKQEMLDFFLEENVGDSLNKLRKRAKALKDKLQRELGVELK